jgi:hypothetical protein
MLSGMIACLNKPFSARSFKRNVNDGKQDNDFVSKTPMPPFFAGPATSCISPGVPSY